MINFYKKIGLEFLFKILCNVNIKKLYIINHNIQYYFENSNWKNMKYIMVSYSVFWAFSVILNMIQELGKYNKISGYVVYVGLDLSVLCWSLNFFNRL